MRSVLAVAAVSAAVLVGCSGGGTTSKQPATQPASPAADTASSLPASPPSGPSPSEARPGTVIKTGDSQFGEILFDATGQAIYLFDKEQSAKPECYDECAEAWPPVLTKGPAVAAGKADADALGMTKRNDGSRQVTYRGQPLYYYAHEGKNKVLCHNVREFGGLWLALTPTGEAATH